MQTYENLPKIEVSFQDDFNGTEREITLTPSYVFKELSKLNVNPQLGNKILLWEKDENDTGENYLCNVGEIIELDEKKIDTSCKLDEVPRDRLTYIDKLPVMININHTSFFRLKSLK